MKLSVKNGRTYLRSNDLIDIAQSHGTPLYIYDYLKVKERVRSFFSSFSKNWSVHYALKANDNRDLLENLNKDFDIGLDVVSGGEILNAIEAGFKPNKILFSGVGKTIEEIKIALSNNIKQINIESPQELERIGSIAKTENLKIDIGFRMNPNVNPKTHPYITTGFRENKFGMDESFIPELKTILKRYEVHLTLRGVSIHIGSLIHELEVFQDAILKSKRIYKDLLKEGFKLDRFDVGGGLGIDYQGVNVPDINSYVTMVEESLADLNCEILCEPGRSIVGESGILITEIQYIKRTPYKNFAIVDTGMHHLIRPALYDSFHRIIPLAPSNGPKELYDVVGPICESSDFLGKTRSLPELKQGDLLAVLDAGAYGYVMASLYNGHALPKEVLLKS